MQAPRLTILVPILVGLLWPVATAAVGLGGATVSSQLNAPLSVEISLVGEEPSSPKTHLVGIASAPAHAAAGIAYTPLVQQLKAEIVSDDGGNTIVRVTSRERVREPVVSFLLELKSSGGRVVRAYAVLLDPPGYRPPKAMPPPDPPADERPEVPTVERLAEAEKHMPGALKGYGPVKTGDTLSQLGYRLRTDAGVTGAQMAWALYEANPHAFRNRDVNGLMAGAHLIVPSRETALQISNRDARRILLGEANVTETVQARDLPLSPPSLDLSVETQIAAGGTPANEKATKIEPQPELAESRLQLVAPETMGDEVHHEDWNLRPEWMQDPELRNLLTRFKDEIRKSREDTVHVHLLIARMERTVTGLMSTVAVKDAEIATLENKLAGLRQEKAKMLSQIEVASVRQVEAKALSRSDLASVPRKKAQEPSESDRASVRQEKAEESSALGWFEANRVSRYWLEMLLALLVFGSVGILGVMLSKRSMAREPPDSTGDADSEGVSKLTEYPELTVKPGDAVTPTSAEILVEYKSLSTDPLLEAKAYFDYGYYKKASELLLEIIERHPEVPTYQLQLLRVLHAAGESKTFLRHASAFLDLLGDRSDPRWMEVARMGREMFPKAELFQSPFLSVEKPSVA